MAAPAWGVDIVQDSTVTLSGPYSIKFVDTVPDSDPFVYGPWHPLDHTAAGSSYFYSVDVALRADSIAGSSTFLIEWEQYAKDKETLVYTRTINPTGAASTLAAINTWQTVGNFWTANSSAYWGRVKITKARATIYTSWNGWVDRIDVYKNPPWAQLGRVTSDITSLTPATYTAVNFNTGSGVGIDISTSTDLITCHVGGIYMAEATVEFVTPSDGDAMRLRLAYGSGPTYRYGPAVAASGTINQSASISATLLLRPGETVWLEAYSTSGSDIAYGSTLEKTRLTLIKVN